MHRTDKFSQHSSIIWPVWQNGCVFVYELSDCGFESCSCHLNFGDWRLLRARSSVAFRQTLERVFTLKLVRDMTITYSRMHCTDKYSQHSSIIWPVWLNGLVFLYELTGRGFESRCCHLHSICGPCFEQGVP